MTGTHPIDGSLPAWEDVEDEADWKVLLLGNGLSVNVWSDFAYGSLFEKAKVGSRHGKLHHRDLAIFEEFGTENFEVVLANLHTTIRSMTALELDARPVVKRYQSVRAALGAAVRAVHITRSEVPDITLETIKDVMEEYDAIFTTSYDLLAYWGMGFYEDFGHLVDLFWSDGPDGKCEFNLARTTVFPDYAPVYFLHGAMHLIVGGSGRTRKLTRTDETILDQFGQPIEGDPQGRPLLISEGSYREKLRAIEDNDYLSYALDRLTNCDSPLVIFGSALAEQDMHLIKAINENPDRPVAVSMRQAGRKARLARQGELRGRLTAHELHFYDAATYPLGDPDLACHSRASRRLLRSSA
jgi:hypothetical protein